MSKRRIVVTSALPYANGDIHLGHLVEYLQTPRHRAGRHGEAAGNGHLGSSMIERNFSISSRVMPPDFSIAAKNCSENALFSGELVV